MPKFLISLGLSACIAQAGLTALLVPALALAQDTGTPVVNYCPNLTITMQRCSADRPISQQHCTDATTEGQVTQLQRFLIDQELLVIDQTTGYFGAKTQAAVRTFQCANLGICSGDEATTGWGVVGPRTRAAIQRVCGTQATTPPPPPLSNPPPAPTCTLDANPSSITLGQSSVLYWSSTNATQGSISSIGSVGPSGSQSILPQQTTAYTGTFWGSGGTASCRTTVTVAVPGETGHASCTLNNQTIPDGHSVTAYQSSSVALGQHCQSEQRTCRNGTLTGSYQYEKCEVRPAVQNSCTTPWGSTVANGQAVTAYQSPTPTNGPECVSERRTCQNGVLSGTYRYPRCDTQGSLSCTLDGVTVEHTQSRTFYSARTSTDCSLISQSRTCTNGTFNGSASYQYAACSSPQTAQGPKACVYKGQTYPNGATVTTLAGTFSCEDGLWYSSYEPRIDVCEFSSLGLYADFNCPTRMDFLGIRGIGFGVRPSYGSVPHTVTATLQQASFPSSSCPSYSISWGDGAADSISLYLSDDRCTKVNTHTYSAAGTYTVTATGFNNEMRTKTVTVVSP